eukprot:CAMPEP_0201251684 /NCGR_PEP_ID=MMETSP0852-20130820/66487_1 /ASSEMBLY_ACC=CAM_ASM_000632 /TAXON_ID=183588 /ORGANISM="Pseudo-nitzschia fraudulenta, Strain WWA7" /LENGTH=377 /DNA_ID=CAMNT_0047551295 /DNA_START=99 /DNA_END=1232 /DNA_ORIENTATION=-
MKLNILLLLVSYLCSQVSASLTGTTVRGQRRLQDAPVKTDNGTVVFANEDGSITVAEDSITATDTNGESFTFYGEVTYDAESESYTVTNEEGSASFSKDGYLLADEDGFIAGSWNGTQFATGNEDGIIYANEDAIVFASEDGSITVTEDSITAADDNGESFTFFGVVSYDAESESYTVTNEEGSASFSKDGYLLSDEDGFVAGTWDGSVISSGDEDGITVTGPDGECLSIPDIVCSSAETSVLCSILNSSPEFWAAASDEEYTLFAPIDEAFAPIEEPLTTLSDDTVLTILLFHTAPGIVTSDDLFCGELLEMNDGGYSRTSCQKNSDREDIVVQKGGGNRKNNLLPEIIMADIEACNGVIHAVNHVMLPNFIDDFD